MENIGKRRSRVLCDRGINVKISGMEYCIVAIAERLYWAAKWADNIVLLLSVFLSHLCIFL